jgi:hypothetical protein
MSTPCKIKAIKFTTNKCLSRIRIRSAPIKWPAGSESERNIYGSTTLAAKFALVVRGCNRTATTHPLVKKTALHTLEAQCFTVAPVRRDICVSKVKKYTSSLDLKCANTFRIKSPVFQTSFCELHLPAFATQTIWKFT